MVKQVDAFQDHVKTMATRIATHTLTDREKILPVLRHAIAIVQEVALYQEARYVMTFVPKKVSPDFFLGV